MEFGSLINHIYMCIVFILSMEHVHTSAIIQRQIFKHDASACDTTTCDVIWVTVLQSVNSKLDWNDILAAIFEAK